MKIKVLMLAAMLAAVQMTANAVQPSMQLVYRYITVPGKPTAEITAGLINPDQTTSEGCERRFGQVRVEGVQFSQSGTTLESFRFTDSRGNQWSIPTGLAGMSNAGRSAASNFIRVGRSYFIDIEVCGSGGYPSLISMFDANVRFGQ
ncbi:hypothetical protein [Caballeronia grimmiae]|uniref:Uncharacterized protein n=1 Tax=Caballeronia grimmiae TaxID=1071679 RepID=A0A069PB57_9BURK|nr:hypothetical protein [Caballeronia grimmiae]KDR34531.1 hypothetical protein BG57_05845 [Caballeronia grimmiae]GGD61288.1 hypothetical protein GCM10010985_14220 [Caballeronia grimmiae]